MIFWILRRSDEPSPTSVACYWKKSLLSTVKSLKAKTTDELSGVCTDITSSDDSSLRKFVALGESANEGSTIIKYSDKSVMKKTLYMDHLVDQFKETGHLFTCQNFLLFCAKEMTDSDCAKIFDETKEQSSKAQWFHLRFGRITASKFFEASRCATVDGSLVASIMGSRSFKGNAATERGQKLEIEIFHLLKSSYPTIKKCGIVITKRYPMFGASPDGINEEYIFEIKCPWKKGTVENYIDRGVVKDKVFFQMQLQMHMCQKEKGILVVADPEFEKNKKITMVEVKLNKAKLNEALTNCKKFWEESIFPILK